PIHLAACTGNLVAIQMLTAARADVNVRDRMGSTPLHDALVHKQGDAAKLLISNGAAVNASDAYGATPLQDAFRFGHKATAKLLVEHGGHMGKFD
ncbi:ankyrin repeat protein, partial [Pavlovales sp. CCMP2436]